MNILVYRDGVSEGQFDIVLNFELPLIKEACVELYNKSMPYITIVVFGKRHNVRLPFWPGKHLVHQIRFSFHIGL
jgi:hypothetical protein